MSGLLCQASNFNDRAKRQRRRVTHPAVSDCSRDDCPTQNGGCSKDKCYCDDGYELSATSPHTCDAPVADLCETDNPCEQLCNVTSDGKSVTCSCDDNHVLNQDERTCRELTKVATEVTVDIPVPSSDLSNSTTYDQWRRQAEDVLQNELKQTVPGLWLVKVTSLRVGSLIIEADIVVNDESNPYAVSRLVYALVALSANSLTIGELSGTVNVRVLGMNVDADSVCEIYTSISKCPEKQHCHADNGQPMCRFPPQDDALASQSLIIGLAVSASVVFAITVVVVVIVVMKKSSKKRKHVSNQNQVPGQANFMSSIPANDGQYPRNALGQPVFFACGNEFNYSRKPYSVDNY